MQNKKQAVEVQGGEIAIRNEHGDIAIVPREGVKKVELLVATGKHYLIDKYLNTLPKLSSYASDGTVIPKDKMINITAPDGTVKQVAQSSDEYKTLYNSGKLMNYDKATDTYIAPTLKEAEVTAPKDPNYKPYTRQQFLKDKAGALGNLTDPNNMPAGYEDQYQAALNDIAAKKILDRLPKLDNPNNRLKWLENFTPAERKAVETSKYAYALEPTGMQKFENVVGGLGTAGVEFKSEGTTQEEANQHAKNPLNMLEPTNIPGSLVQAAFGKGDIKTALQAAPTDADFTTNVLAGLAGDGIVGLAGVGAKQIGKQIGKQIFKNTGKNTAKLGTLAEETSNVLTDFKARINTEEGQRRAAALGVDIDRLQDIGLQTPTPYFDDVNAHFNTNTNDVVVFDNMPIKYARTVTRHELEHGVQVALPNPKITIKAHLDEKRGFKEFDHTSVLNDEVPFVIVRKDGLTTVSKKEYENLGLKVDGDSDPFNYVIAKTDDNLKIGADEMSNFPYKYDDIDHWKARGYSQEQAEAIIQLEDYKTTPEYKDFFSNVHKEQGTTEIDKALDKLVLRKVGYREDLQNTMMQLAAKTPAEQFEAAMLDASGAVDYFKTGSNGSERAPFLSELQQWMVDSKIIPDAYTPLTPKLLNKAKRVAKNSGKTLRILNILDPDYADYNDKIIIESFNKLLVPITIGTAAGMVVGKNQKQNDKTQ